MKIGIIKRMSGMSAAALVFALFAAAPVVTNAAGDPFRVTENPAGASYRLNETAAPLRATFQYNPLEGTGHLDSEAPISVRWYWSYNNSNADRTNGLSGSAVAYGRQISHTTTLTPATDVAGVKYYYAVIAYAQSVTDDQGQWASVPKETVTDPARIEVTVPEHGFRVRKTDENGNLLSGATLALVPDAGYSQDPTVKSYEQTTANGFSTFTAPPGYYILYEKNPPDGYDASSDKYYILITESGVFTGYNISPNYIQPYDTVTFVNVRAKEPEYSFSVRKTDESGNLLSGAALALVPDGNYAQSASAKAQEAVTANGYATFTAAPGYYILSEKQAPEGYNASDAKYYIRVTDTGVFTDYNTQNPKPYQQVTFTDSAIPALNKEDHFAYMVGYPEGTFGPSRNMTRAEAVVMFSRLLSNSINMSVDYRDNYYPDVDLSAWYANQVCYMRRLGVLADYCRDGNFRPADFVTRAEFATLAAHFDNLTLTGKNVFSDVPNSHWAVKYINSAAAKGWILGYPDGTFKPEANITRAEVVTLVNKMLKRAADGDYLSANKSSLPKDYGDLTSAHWAYYHIMEASVGHDYIRDSSGEHWTAAY
ncbi:MAG: S-layer homology domain-containing protein [Firmicutes bacterium]|nr:S-layer homology domain-containing protein [Bacillota bacterium]